MLGPLDDIDSRLRWAGKQIEQIDVDIRAFLKDGPMYEIAVQPQSDGRTYIYTVERGRPLPEDLRFRVGDAMHNLRATLDNIAYGLVSTYRKPIWNTAFPVCRNASQFKIKALPKFAGIDQGAIDIIESFQPYKDRNGDWLKVLDGRWNRDKHRAPMLVGLIPSRFSMLENDGDIADYVIYVDKGLKDGMAVSHVVYKSDQHTRREPHLTFEIAIEERGTPTLWRGIPNALQACHYLVRDEVLKRLRPYFR